MSESSWVTHLRGDNTKACFQGTTRTARAHTQSAAKHAAKTAKREPKTKESQNKETTKTNPGAFTEKAEQGEAIVLITSAGVSHDKLNDRHVVTGAH